MPRNKRKHPHTRYERIMLTAINTLPFKFHSPGQPNPYKPVPPNTKKYVPEQEEHQMRMNPDRKAPPGQYRSSKGKANPPKQVRNLMN